MKKGISISLLALSLAACGGGGGSNSSDSNDENILSLKTDFAVGIRGSEQEPTVTAASVSEGDTVALNTRLTGSIPEDGSIRFSFTPTETTIVALVLSSTAEDLDLELTDSNYDVNIESSDSTSNEAIIFDAISGTPYFIDVDAYGKGGSFQLKLVEANRSSLGLSNDEYVVITQLNIAQECVEDGQNLSSNTTEVQNKIINWKGGYVLNLSGENKTSFTSVNDNSFSIADSTSESYSDGESYSNISIFNYTTNFATGELTGDGNYVETYTDNAATETCTSEVEITGKVVL
jgi:hypothetical protein